MKGQITACGFVTDSHLQLLKAVCIVKGQITACGFVTPCLIIAVAFFIYVKGQITACGFVTFVNRIKVFELRIW